MKSSSVNRASFTRRAIFWISALAGLAGPATAQLVNGSFESGYTGWTASGNQSLASSAPYVASHGSKLVTFNNGNAAPNGVLSQSVPTTPGQTYTVLFDAGILAYNNNVQRLQVELSGSSVLATQIFPVTRSGSAVVSWFPKSVSFTANSATTRLTFRDRSETTVSADLLLDHVRVELPVTRTLTVASSPLSGISVDVGPPDQNGETAGVTGFSRRYSDGKVVNLTTPAAFGGLYPDKTIYYHFQRWLKNGVPFDTRAATSLAIDSDTAMTAVYVQDPPFIATQPAGVFTGVGGSVAFEVSASGGSLSYQWRFNGTPIPGAGGSSYTINGVQASQAGSYDVVVTNAGGSTTSDPALLSIVPGSLVNGSFESGYDGWTVAGNQEIQSTPPYAATDGVKLVSFNSINSAPNGVLSQTFATEPGQSYLVTFDMGFLAYNRNEQRLRVEVSGNSLLSSGEFTIKSLSGETLRWVARSILFTADSTAATLTFLDRSPATVSLDLLLDHVAVTKDPSGFVLVPAGAFKMGDTFPFSGNFELPVRNVQLDAFYMAKYEVTGELWNEVWSWASVHGYTDLPVGNSKGTNHPVQTVGWDDVLKWCNARSEKEGLTPCYTVSGTIYRTGHPLAPDCNWTTNGYRLPTEAEWEKSARGGLADKRFPWGNTITHSEANYSTSDIYDYDISPTRGYHPIYQAGGFPYTSPVGSFQENGYGLHDMAGNVFEWCWDFWAEGYDPSQTVNPKGPASGSLRIVRGGSWGDQSYYCRNAARSATGPLNSHSTMGFRLTRSVIP